MTVPRKPASLAWMVLMLATCITTWGLSTDAFLPTVATLGTFLIAAFKARLVLLHFMELRHAPLPWRLLMEAWVVATTAAILGIYLQTVPA
jgi:hypothetical protein